MNVAEKEKIFEELDIVLLTKPNRNKPSKYVWRLETNFSNYINKGKPFVILYLIIM